MQLFFLIFLQKIKKNNCISLRRGFEKPFERADFEGEVWTFVTSPKLSAFCKKSFVQYMRYAMRRKRFFKE
jgi:hypothetical protein